MDKELEDKLRGGGGRGRDTDPIILFGQDDGLIPREDDARRDDGPILQKEDIRQDDGPILGVSTLVIGCGNLLRGDDAVGPVLIRRMWERGVPGGVQCTDSGTSGVNVMFQMRGVPHLVLVDACQSGAVPGTIFEIPISDLAQLPPMRSINLHSFRWDHAVAFGRWWLKDEFPVRTTVYLIEGADFQVGMNLTPSVDRAINSLVERLIDLVTIDTIVG